MLQIDAGVMYNLIKEVVFRLPYVIVFYSLEDIVYT